MRFPERLGRLIRRLAAVGGTALLGVGLTAGAAAPASGTTIGYVRLAHLSPDTPPVDVYLAAAGSTAEPRVFRAVGYGVMSKYLPLPAGRYAVAMRGAAAPASDPPVLTTDVSVTSGRAYTVAGVGRYADLGLRVLDDDLTPPADGRAKVRVVQASVRAPVISVAASDGPTIADAVPFASTTPYEQVEPGRWKLRLAAAGGETTTANVRLDSGRVYSLLVLDAKRGGLTTDLRVDAEKGTVVPTGGVDTGAGGTGNGGTSMADGDAGRPPYLLVAAAAGTLVAVSAAVGAVVLRRRTRHLR